MKGQVRKRCFGDWSRHSDVSGCVGKEMVGGDIDAMFLLSPEPHAPKTSTNFIELLLVDYSHNSRKYSQNLIKMNLKVSVIDHGMQTLANIGITTHNNYGYGYGYGSVSRTGPKNMPYVQRRNKTLGF